MKKSIIRCVKSAYRETKKSFSAEHGEYLWIYDNFYLIDRHYHSVLKAKELLKTIEESGCFDIIQSFCEQKSYKFDESELCEHLRSAGEQHFFTCSEIYSVSAIISSCAIIRIGKACESGEGLSVIPNAVNLLRFVGEIDIEDLFDCVWIPEQTFLRCEKDYGIFDEVTKNEYRSAFSSFCRVRKLKEDEGIRLLAERAEKEDRTLGSLLFVRRKSDAFIYFAFVIVFLGLFALLSFLAISYWTILLLIPLYEAAVCIADFITSLFVINLPAARLRLETVPENAKTLVVITSLLFGAERDDKLFKNLERYYLLNKDPNIFFCILGDLSDSKAKENENDINIIQNAKEKTLLLNQKHGERFCLFVRERTENKSDGIFGGRERKRGAVTELVGFITGSKPEGEKNYTGGSFINNIKYIYTLDADTNLSLGGVKELLGVALHPLNEPKILNGRVAAGHAIFQPLMRTELSGAYKTRFSRLISGVGGTDIYESAAFDRYQSIFGSGVFCGKGLFSVELFDRLVTPKLPDGRILSHDILEGGILRTCFVSDISLTDSTPKNTVSYMGRLHRWIRGDFQNLYFLKGDTLDKQTKFKLLSNVIRHLAPLFAVITVFAGALTTLSGATSFLLILFAFLYLVVPFILSVIVILCSGKPFALRRFFSQASTAISQTVTRTLYELCASAHMAYNAADAACRAIWRMAVSKKKLLEWVTAVESDLIDKTSIFYYIRKTIVSAIIGAVLFLFAPGYPAKLLGLAYFLFPVLAHYESKALSPNSTDIYIPPFTKEDKEFIKSQARDMWAYFADNVDKKSNYLPPDNIQLSPAEHVAYRTSPTNIGFYLISALAAKDFGFITADEMLARLEKSLLTIQSMPKFKGHLYNWYELKNITVLGNGYISTVDSGNFVAMLVVLKNGLKEIEAEYEKAGTLAKICETLIEETDFKILYNTKRNLFALGMDTNTGKQDNICYDLFMSEARLASYYACARGIVPKRHWRSLGRTLTTGSGYIGMISWSGTTFEFLMPHLFLPVYRNSFLSESLVFAMCEQRRARYGKLWGISESAFYSFDSDMNYQYKAHGVQKIALKRYMSDEAVLSPYSTFLSLIVFRRSAVQNIKNFEEAGMYGRYGLYEAIDMTPARYKGAAAGEKGVIVRCYMAHHIGMSIIACANAALKNVFVDRFMKDGEMGAAYELLQEKIPTDAHMFEDERKSFAPDLKLPAPRRYRVVTENENALQMPSVTYVNKGNMSILCSGSGHVLLNQGSYPINDTEFSRYSLKHSLTVQFFDGESFHGCAPLYGEGVYSFEKGGFYASHISSSKAFSGRVKYTIHPKADAFVIETKAESKRSYNLMFCFEPLIAELRSYNAHPSFSKLFTEAQFDEKDKILFFSRRPRSESENEVFLAVALSDAEINFSFTTRKDIFNAWGMNTVSDITRAHLDNAVGPCVNPVCIIKTEQLQGGKAELLISLSFSKKEAKANIIKARKSQREPDNGVVIQPESERILQSLLFPKSIKPVNEFAGGGINTLWKQSISGDNRIVTLFLTDPNEHIVYNYLSAFLALSQANVRFDLLFVIEDKDKYMRPVERGIRDICEKLGLNSFLDRNGGIFIRTVDKSDSAFVKFIKICSSLYIDVVNDTGTHFKAPPVQFAEEIKTAVSGGKTTVPSDAYRVYGGFFNDGSFDVEKEFPLKMPYSYVLSGRSFGSVIADSSLCYTFADNSREKRITPFEGDPYSLSDGERFLLQLGGYSFDLCAVAYSVKYKNGTVIYEGSVYKSNYTLTVFCCENIPVKFYRLKFDGIEKARAVLITKPVMGAATTGAFSLQVKRRATQNTTCMLFKNETSADFSDGVGFIGVIGNGKAETDYALVVFGKESGVDDTVSVSVTGNDSVFFIGSCDGEESAAEVIDCMNHEQYRSEYERAVGFAQTMLPPVKLENRSRSASIMFNTFIPYQVSACRFFARASFYQSGGAYGFRDQLQDCLCLVYSSPSLVREHILRACAHQYTEGDVQHWWHPIVANGTNRGVRTKCSDDFLWLPYVTADYIKKTGDYGILEEDVEYITSPILGSILERYELPNLSGIKESVYKHCLRALSNGEIFGRNGLSLMGSCDWNDAFSEVGALGKGESVFTSFLFIMSIREFLPLMMYKKDNEIASHYRAVSDVLLDNIEKNAFIGEWYARAIHDDGRFLGVKGNKECEIDILPQCFAAMVKGADFRVCQALDIAYDKLFDKKNKILKLFTPPFKDGDMNVGYIKGYVAGIRENGGQYTHAAIWGAIGFICAGKKEAGLEILSAINPASRCADFDAAKRYKIEPYVLAADIYSTPEHAGRGGWSWYTGAAAWYYKATIEYVMGIQLSEGFSKINVKPITEYKAEIAYNDYSLTVISGREQKTPLLDGNPVSMPLVIPSGNHVLYVPVE